MTYPSNMNLNIGILIFLVLGYITSVTRLVFYEMESVCVIMYGGVQVWRRCRGAKDVDLVREAGRGRVRVRVQEPGRHVRRCRRVRQGVGDAAISRVMIQ